MRQLGSERLSCGKAAEKARHSSGSLACCSAGLPLLQGLSKAKRPIKQQPLLVRLPQPPDACPIIGLVDEAADEQSAIEELKARKTSAAG
jgi:hypothetical protein